MTTGLLRIITYCALSIGSMLPWSDTKMDLPKRPPVQYTFGLDLERVEVHGVETTTTTTTRPTPRIRPTVRITQPSSRPTTIAPVVTRPTGPSNKKAILACIRKNEGGGYTTVSKSGKYRGAYQMDQDFWNGYGDGSAPTADLASVGSQDAAAWRAYLVRGFGPWPPSQGKC